MFGTQIFNNNNYQRIISRSSRNDRRRNRYTVYICWLVLPVLIIFPFFNNLSGGLANLLIALILTIAVSVIAIDATRWELGKRLLPNLGGAVATFCLLYFTYLGHEDGASLLWMYCFPMLAMFLTGLGPGSLMCTGLLIASVVIMQLGVDIGAYAYSDATTIRFAVSFFLVSAMAYGFEYWRVGLEIAKEDMGEELSRTRLELDALAGLANVCAWCKSVKNQDGTWLTLEDYVARTESAAVSHAICPDCAKDQHANIDREAGS